MKPGYSRADHAFRPPVVEIPRDYNAAHDLIGRNLDAGRGPKAAYLDDAGPHSYDDLEAGSARVAGLLRAVGVAPEQRVLVCMLDSFALPCVFLGAIRAGIVPVLVNTLLTVEDYAFMAADSRARVAIVSAPLAGPFRALLGRVAGLERVIVCDDVGGEDEFANLLGTATPYAGYAPTVADEACFWLYSSGSTGNPKGTVHVHSSLIQTAELYARPTLAIAPDDIVFSAAKLFFAYGLGNALSFPLAFGATTVLMAERPTPAAVFKRLRDHRVSIFYGVPTLYASLLAADPLPPPADFALRCCTSAGEALPADLGQRWRAHFGVDILDGIGSTEMLHIFLSNTPDDLRYGTTGKTVPGYRARLVDDTGDEVAAGEIGELQVAGPTAAAHYWNNRSRSRATFQGEWTRTGDKYRQDTDGYFVYCGRSDDMLKVGGIYVAPAEVEAALASHPAVLECAVVGREDSAGLVKPAAFVVAAPGILPDPALAEALKDHVKHLLAPYKYPRTIEFVAELPKTATGKIQRFRLRQRS